MGHSAAASRRAARYIGERSALEVFRCELRNSRIPTWSYAEPLLAREWLEPCGRPS